MLDRNPIAAGLSSEERVSLAVSDSSTILRSPTLSERNAASNGSSYTHDMTVEDHADLLDILCGFTRASVVLSGHHSPMTRSVLAIGGGMSFLNRKGYVSEIGQVETYRSCMGVAVKFDREIRILGVQNQLDRHLVKLNNDPQEKHHGGSKDSQKTKNCQHSKTKEKVASKRSPPSVGRICRQPCWMH